MDRITGLGTLRIPLHLQSIERNKTKTDVSFLSLVWIQVGDGPPPLLGLESIFTQHWRRRPGHDRRERWMDHGWMSATLCLTDESGRRAIRGTVFQRLKLRLPVALAWPGLRWVGPWPR